MIDPRLDRQLEQRRDAALPEGLAERLAARLPADVAPARPLPAIWVRTALLFALLAGIAVLLGFAAGGKGWKALDTIQRGSLIFVTGAGAAWLAHELAVRMSPAPRLRWSGLLPALIVPLAATAWVLVETPATGSSPLFYPICLGFTSLGVALAAVATWRALKHGFAPRRSAIFAAAAGGLAGFGAVELFCPFVDAPHIMSSHLFPALLCAAVAVWLMARSKTA